MKKTRALLACVLALLLALPLNGCAQTRSEEPTPATTAPEPVSEPASGTLLSGSAPRDPSQLTITLAPTASSVVMLKNTSGTVLLSFYVRRGDTVTVDVPSEELYVHFASGQTWYGPGLLFGEDTVYSQDPEPTDFSKYTCEYNYDPTSDAPFDTTMEQEPTEDARESILSPTTPTEPGYVGDLSGHWESVTLNTGGFALNVHAMVFSETIHDCTQLTVNMNVTMNAGTKCRNWQLWGRGGPDARFVKLEIIDLPDGDGSTSQTVTFSDPVTFDALLLTPTVSGGYSWSMRMSITDVWVEP